MDDPGSIGGLLPRRRQLRGASAVEAAIVMPMLLAFVYGLIYYSYLFVLQETVTYAAQEAAEAAVAVDPRQDDDAYTAAIETEARQTVVEVFDWLPAGQQIRVLGADGDGSQTVAVDIIPDASGIGATVAVTVRYTVIGGGDTDGGLGPLFPVLRLPAGIGVFPPLPDQLVSRGTASI